MSAGGRARSSSGMFTGAALDGVPQDVNDDEVAPHPDLDHPIIMPFNREIAWFPGDLWIGDAPYQACSRQILKRVTAEAAMLGYTFNLGIETEDFGYAPFDQRGGLGKVHQLFGAELPKVLEALNRELAA